jgi:hypothetical protein
VSLDYAVRPIKTWPEDWRRDYPPDRYSPFSAKFSDTEALLHRELEQLGASNVIVQIDVPPTAMRIDGTLRANATANDPGVILSFTTPLFGALSYPCRAFAGRWGVPGWQANLRAIALGLEALRKVERYGIAERGQQYAGFAALGSGIALGPARMSLDEAARVLAEGTDGECDGGDLLWTATEADGDAVRRAFKQASAIHHPDVSGEETTERFQRIVDARDRLLEAAR